MNRPNTDHSRPFRFPRLTVLAVLPLFVACSPTQGQQAKAAPRSDPSASLTQPHTACWLIPPGEVAGILGEPVHPVADLGGMKYGHSGCSYFTGEDGSGERLLTLGLDWDGFITQSMRFPERGEETPYSDIGDGAVLTSGVLFVRIGQRSLAIDSRSKKDLHALAERLIAAARSKMAS